jgi:hypothetical protein
VWRDVKSNDVLKNYLKTRERKKEGRKEELNVKREMT